jgi:hypothetical protein
MTKENIMGTQNSEHDEDAYDAKLDAINERVEAAFPDGLVVFSAFPEDKDGLPVDVLDEIAANGPVIFVAKHDPFFGEGKDFRSAKLTSPTWLEVVAVANLAVKCTGNEHHVYLEGITETNQENGVTVFRLKFGS